jgi:hypothetical protein
MVLARGSLFDYGALTFNGSLIDDGALTHGGSLDAGAWCSPLARGSLKCSGALENADCLYTGQPAARRNVSTSSGAFGGQR